MESRKQKYKPKSVQTAQEKRRIEFLEKQKMARRDMLLVARRLAGGDK